MLALIAPESRGTYLVVKPFRFRGRDFTRGEEFNALRLDPTPARLNELYRDGCLSLPDRKADAAYRKARLKAMEDWKPPQPTVAASTQLQAETPLYGEDHED